MKKCLLIILILIALIPAVTAMCCEKNADCILTETCQDGACGVCTIVVYNPAGSVNMTQQNLTQVTTHTYSINLSNNLTQYATYPYTINCTTNKTCEGECYVEINQYCGVDDSMSNSVILFLLVFNAGLFLTPIIVKRLHSNEVADYVIKRMIILAGIIFLWFNTTILRTLAIDYNLGIDNFLEAYWWVFTIAMFAVIFLSLYFITIGAVKLAKEAEFRRRMGMNDEETYY